MANVYVKFEIDWAKTVVALESSSANELVRSLIVHI